MDEVYSKMVTAAADEAFARMMCDPTPLYLFYTKSTATEYGKLFVLGMDEKIPAYAELVGSRLSPAVIKDQLRVTIRQLTSRLPLLPIR